MPNWQPKITTFLCHWCSYGAADLAGVSRLQYPPHFRIIRVPCDQLPSARDDPKPRALGGTSGPVAEYHRQL